MTKSAMIGWAACTRLPAQGLLEYSAIIALVAVVAIAGLLFFGAAVSSMLSSFADISESAFTAPQRIACLKAADRPPWC